jgi:hypothetical protein
MQRLGAWKGVSSPTQSLSRKRNLPLNHFTKWPRVSLKTGRSGSTFGRHSLYADQCVAVVLTVVILVMRSWLTRQAGRGHPCDAILAYSAGWRAHFFVRIFLRHRSYAFPVSRLTHFSCHVLLPPPTSSLSFQPRASVSVSTVRGFELVTLLREMYLVTTSPSGHAQVVKWLKRCTNYTFLFRP